MTAYIITNAVLSTVLVFFALLEPFRKADGVAAAVWAGMAVWGWVNVARVMGW